MRIAAISLARSPVNWATDERCISVRCTDTSCSSRALARRRTVETQTVARCCARRSESFYVRRPCEWLLICVFSIYLTVNENATWTKINRYALGIPTTRAATLVASASTVARDRKYNGNVQHEPCAVVLRVAPTFLRFGSFQVHSYLAHTAFICRRNE